MPRTIPSLELYDPRTGAEALRLFPLTVGGGAYEPPRSNQFAIYWIQRGSGTFSADSAHHVLRPGLLFFKPYQYIRFEPQSHVAGDVIQFHANFLCVETFHAEVGCAGLLFNDPYGAPFVALDEPSTAELERLVACIRRELAGNDLARDELLLAYMKVLLILATRLKTSAASIRHMDKNPTLDADLEQLKELIEQNYRDLHRPSEYARLMHRTPKTLGRLVRERLGKTLGDLIRERILTHAKWQLLHTLKPVKQVAREVGFRDELYFSRLFKKATGLSPRDFRAFETEIRGGSNLSMFLGDPPIPPNADPTDTLPVRVEESRGRRGRRSSKS